MPLEPGNFGNEAITEQARLFSRAIAAGERPALTRVQVARTSHVLHYGWACAMCVRTPFV